MSDKRPSGYRVEQALAVWFAARQRVLNDPDLAMDEAALTDLLGEAEGDIDDVLARLLRASVHAKAMADAAGDRIDDLKARQERYKRRAQDARGTAFAIMDTLGRSKFEMADMTVSIRAGTSSVLVTDEASVPDIYVEVVTTRKVDRATILSALKSGLEVPGCELSNGLPSLAIRTK